MVMEINNWKEYNKFLKEILTEINSARYKAQVSINTEHITSNFTLGKIIVEKQKQNSLCK